MIFIMNEKYLIIDNRTIEIFKQKTFSGFKKSDVINIVLKSIEMMIGGELFVPKISSYRIMDLVRAIDSNSKIQVTGIRPGEKLTEYLLTDFEMENVLETKDFFILPSLFKSFHRSSYPNAKKPKNLYLNL